MGKPASADIIGSELSVYPTGKPERNYCRKCRNKAHHRWECFNSYIEVLGEPCPSSDANCQKEPSAWHNDQLTPAARAALVAYIAKHQLQVAGEAPRGPSF